MRAGAVALVAVLIGSGCVDRTLEAGREDAVEAGVDDPSSGQDDAADDSGPATTPDPTEEPVVDPYPDCRPLLQFDMQDEPTTCGAAIGVIHVEGQYDPELCDACMCARSCADAGDCPAPPSRPLAEMHCTAHVQYGGCLIACSTAEDCPPEMICRGRAEYLPDAPPKVCAFAALRPQCDPF